MESSSSSQRKSGDDLNASPDNEPGGKNYEDKFTKLQKYLPFLNTTIARLESTKDKVSQLNKMKNLQQILTSSKQKMKIDTLERCELVLKKLEERLKFRIPADNTASSKKIKTEPDEVMESPASPPQHDLNPPKTTPKIIPVERCATVERDFSKAQEETTLEASRSRLKDVMLKNDLKSSGHPTPPPLIPVLDRMFPSKESLIYKRTSLDGTTKAFESDLRNQSPSVPHPLLREEWNRLENSPQSSVDSGSKWSTCRDVDDRRLNRDLDYRHVRRDIDDRQPSQKMSGPEPHGIQVQSLMGHSPLFPPTMAQRPPLLPRHMPTHNMGYSQCSSSSSQDHQGPVDNMHLDTFPHHKVISKTSVSACGQRNSPLLPPPPNNEHLDRPNSNSRCSVSVRDLNECPSSSLLPTPKPFSTSKSHVEDFERSSLVGDSTKPSARERIMQRLDHVEKLGVSSGGALRKLKSDLMERSKRRTVETDSTPKEELCQRSTDLVSRTDPRLEKEQRRASLDDEAQKLRAPLRSNDFSTGTGGGALLPHNAPGFPGQTSFGSSLTGCAKWNQSHINSPSGRASFSGQVINTLQWQTTCTVKQMTTAHDLGLRYQSKARHGKVSHNPQYERGLPSSAVKSSDDKYSGSRDSESRRRESDSSLVLGKRQSDPRLFVQKSVDEKKCTESRNVDPSSRRKEKAKNKDDDFASPLNSLYNEDGCRKTGQGYGIQNYRIPKRAKEPSPVRDLQQPPKQGLTDARSLVNRDPRLSKITPRPQSPESVLESISEPPSSSCSLDQDIPVALESAHGNAAVDDDVHNQTISSSQTKARSRSPSLEKHGEYNKIRSGSPHPKSQGGVSMNSSQLANVSQSRARSRGRSSDCREQSRGRSRSKSSERSSSRSRAKSKCRSPANYTSRSSVSSSSKSREKSPQIRARSRERSRSASITPSRGRSRSGSRSEPRERSCSRSTSVRRSTSRTRDKSRGRSTSRSRAKSRGRSTSRTRAKSRGRSQSRTREKTRERSLSRTRGKSRGRSPLRSRDRSKGRSPSRTRGKSRGRSPSRTRGKSRGRSPSRTRGKSRGRSPSRTRGKSRGRSPSRTRGKSRGRSSSRDGDKSRGRSSSHLRNRTRSRDRSSSRSQNKFPVRSPSHSKSISSKSRSRQSRSRSHSRERSSSHPRGKSVGRDCRKSRARSHSSDSDANSMLSSWTRKESPSPDRYTNRSESTDRSRKRSISSGSNYSRDSSTLRQYTTPRNKSRARSRSRSRKQPNRGYQSKRSVSRDCSEDVKKQASSRSSSGSGRSSPLFPKDRSQSRSPSRDLDFDTLFQKSKISDMEILVSSGGVKDDNIKTLPANLKKETVVSSSSSSCDVVVDVPTSTSENVPEVAGKSDAGSSTEISTRNNLKPQLLNEAKQENVGASVKTENILVGFLKTLAGQDLFKQTSLIELAELAASQLPEDKRNKVLELFKESAESTSSEAEPRASQIGEKTKEEKEKEEQEKKEQEKKDDSVAHTINCNVKGGKKKKLLKGKVKNAQDISAVENIKKTEILPEGSEKKQKKRGKNELEKLHEDIREMFISKEVVTATGQRSCRMRKESLPPLKSRPGSADEKNRPSKSKSQVDEMVDFSDDSPSKGQASDTTESSSGYQPEETIKSKTLRYLSDSDDEMPASKWRKTSADSSSSMPKRGNKMNFPESESESDSALADELSKLQSSLPKIVLDKSDHIRVEHRIARRNVARRGRKVGSLSRDNVVMRQEICSPSYDTDCDDEESKIEDKDMSQIDTSNIIQVEGGRSKLTRNQLKLLKGPDPKYDAKSGSKRIRNISECGSDTSKLLESPILKEDESSPLVFESPSTKKKRKKVINLKRGLFSKQQIVKKENKLIDISDTLMSEENIAQDSSIETADESSVNVVNSNDNYGDGIDIISVDSSSPIKVEDKSQDKVCSSSADEEMHEVPLISRLQNVTPQKQEPSKYHEDLKYSVAAANTKVFCKICPFHGKTIVSHYVASHPFEEVLISRLPQDLADRLKAKAHKYQQDLDLLISTYSVKKRSSRPLKCLVCNVVAPTSLRLFEHVTSHTGEYRYSCTQCKVRTAQRMTMKSHRRVRHGGASDKELCTVLSMETAATMNILFAYVCSECNFFQLYESNLKKHLKTYHSQSSSVRSIRVRISQEIPLKAEQGVCSKPDDMKSITLKPKEIEDCSVESQSETLENESFNKKVDEIIEVSDETIKDSAAAAAGSCSEPSVSVDMSIFIGSEQPSEDEHELQEERRKLLEDAGVKIRERPKMRRFISEKLAERLQSGQPQNTINKLDNMLCVSEDKYLLSQLSSNISSSPDGEKLLVTGRSNLRTTPARLAQKPDGADKRFTRSTSRTTIAATSDPECQIMPSEVPDEVRDPLPASTLHSTLKRMQETIHDPVLSLQPSCSLPMVASTCEISVHSQFALKKGTSVKVGLIEARAVAGPQTFLLFCFSNNCTFSTGQTSMFLNHISIHPPKPLSAPCSLCEEDGKILRNLQSSFNHILKYHLVPVSQKEISIASTNPSSSVSLDTSCLLSSHKPSLIRPRKLPGDILSQPDALPAPQGASSFVSNLEENDLPSLVISSVVSLSKAHTPDGTPLDDQRSTPSITSSQCSHDEKPIGVGCSRVPSLPGSKITSQIMKDRASMQEMMRLEKLCHLFKCRGQHCSFSTNSKEKFAEHYSRHSLKELNKTSNGSSNIFEWQKCVYCADLKNSGPDLAGHILLQHCGLIYQCSGCFYRAASVASVAFHQKNSHSTNVVVQECYKFPMDSGMPQVKRLPQNGQIKPYKCCQGSGNGDCGMMFVSSEDFLLHLKTHHLSDNVLYCSECGLGLDSSDKLIFHYSTSHSFRKFHCFHCPKASETSEEISCHMCLDHPDQEMIVADRHHRSDPIQLPHKFVIGSVNLGDEFLKQTGYPYVSPFTNNSETDSCNDEIFFDEEPTLTSLCFDIGAKWLWLAKLSEDEFFDKAAADEPNKGSSVFGLAGSSLYLCGYSGCSFKADSSFSFKEHLIVCGYAEVSRNLSCVHCQKVFRYPSMLIDHLPKHGVPRYLCSLCSYKTTHPTIVIRHVKNVHKISAVEVVPLHPGQSDPDTALHSARQKENVSKRGKGKAQQLLSNKSRFGPEERHMLPLSAVFTQDVMCASCQYTTKVRSNMIRHLEQHALGCEPASVPVLNPVPCLERNEKMFDTMTNHAISSTIPVRRDSNAFKVTDEPKFVPENQRYVCCAPSCHQISSDDAMLRHHIRVLHPEILVYKCPHCLDSDSDSGKQPIMLEKLGSHLRMHDSRLYSCLICSYYHYQRHIVERHTGEKHPDQKLIRVVREPQPDGSVVDTDSEISGTEGTFECGLCSAKGTKSEVTAHVASVHRIHALFKCAMCNFRSNVRARFSTHFAKHHPNDKEDFIEVLQKSKVEKPLDDTLQPVVEAPAPPAKPVVFNSTPLWQRGASRYRHVRGIFFEENGLKPKELEHSDMSNMELLLTSVGNKRPMSGSDDIPGSKREKRDDISFTCYKCSSKFPVLKEDTYREHLRLHFLDDSRFKCARCLKDFQSYDEVITHVSATHQRISSAADVIDTHSEEYLDLYITRQFLNLGLPVEAPILTSRGQNQVASPITSAKNNQKLLSPQKAHSGYKLPPTQSPITKPSTSGDKVSPPVTKLISPKISKSPLKGIRALHQRSVLKPVPSAELLANPPSSGSLLTSKPADLELLNSSSESIIEETKCSLGQSWNKGNEEMEVDESAFEKDIEEIEDEEVCSEEKVESSSICMEISSPSESSGVSTGIVCKYKDSHGCSFISKDTADASYHEKKHWEVKPFKCGHCHYQAIRESYIKLHSGKKHPDAAVQILVNKLPSVPKILPLSRQHNKTSLTPVMSPISHTNPSVDKKIPDVYMAELNDEELFKSVNVLRCGFCRLRETSLSRLFTHWQSCHKSNKTLCENAPDGRRIVPFKFREVKLGNHEKETMAFRCALCSRSGSVKLLLEHYPHRHPGKKLKISGLIHDRVQCSLCPRQFSSKAALTSHFLSSHPGQQVGSIKVKAKDTSNDLLDNSMGCLYCLEPVKTASAMKEHHLNFHSHLDPKYIELDISESEELLPTKSSNAECSLSGLDKSEQCDSEEASSNRPSVIQCGRTASQKELPPAQLDSTVVLQTVVKRAVAKKSTSKFRAVARKSTGGRSTLRIAPKNTSNSSSDSDSSDDECILDLTKITCPMMFDGSKTRVSVATLPQYILEPKVLLKKIDS